MHFHDDNTNGGNIERKYLCSFAHSENSVSLKSIVSTPRSLRMAYQIEIRFTPDE